MPIPLNIEGSGLPIVQNDKYQSVENDLWDLLAEGKALLKRRTRLLGAPPCLETVARWWRNCRVAVNQVGSIMPDIVTEFRRLEPIDREYAGDVGVNLPPDEIVEGPNWRAIKTGVDLIKDALVRLAPDSGQQTAPKTTAPRALPRALRRRWDTVMMAAEKEFPQVKGGFRADLKRIVAVKMLLPKYGSIWRRSLPDLCSELDSHKINPPSPHSSESGRPQPKTWAECLRDKRASVVNTLAYARKQSRKLGA